MNTLEKHVWSDEFAEIEVDTGECFKSIRLDLSASGESVSLNKRDVKAMANHLGLRKELIEHTAEDTPENNNLVLLKIKGCGKNFIRLIGTYEFGKYFVQGSDSQVHPVGWYYLVDVNAD